MPASSRGFSFSLDAEDDGGTAEGGAAVANKFVANPAVGPPLPGHIFSGATAAAIPIYEKAAIPMMSPSATNPKLTTTGSKVFNRDVLHGCGPGQICGCLSFTTSWASRIWQSCTMARHYGQGLCPGCQGSIHRSRWQTWLHSRPSPPANLTTALRWPTLLPRNPKRSSMVVYTAEAVVVINQMKASRPDRRHLLR